jgi:hypothetical protein
MGFNLAFKGLIGDFIVCISFALDFGMGGEIAFCMGTESHRH